MAEGADRGIGQAGADAGGRYDDNKGDLLKDKEGLSHQVQFAGAGAPSGWVCSGCTFHSFV